MYIGEIFLEFVNMLPAFQTYCLQQSTSVNMLNTLEKEKELLRYTQRKDVKLQLDSREGKVTHPGSLFWFLPQMFGVILNGEDGALSIMQRKVYFESRAEMIHIF